MKTDIKIPGLGNKFFDLRDSLPGDSFNWSWERPLKEVKYLVVHHTATDDNQTAEDIANYHVKSNGWGGIGYHFLVDKEGFVFYVGDLSTARANVANMNDAVIGIALVGNFTEGRVPTVKQLESTRKLCEFLIVGYPDLPSVNAWIIVKGHKELPRQKTLCPGDTWQNWKQKIIEPVKTTSEVEYVHTSGSDKDTDVLKSQIDNLQTSLALVEQQRISLQEVLQEREKEILNLRKSDVQQIKEDNTLTILQALFSLYKLILPGKVETFA